MGSRKIVYLATKSGYEYRVSENPRSPKIDFMPITENQEVFVVTFYDGKKPMFLFIV